MSEQHPYLGHWVVSANGKIEGEVDSVHVWSDGTNVVSLVDAYGNPVCEAISDQDVELFEKEHR